MMKAEKIRTGIFAAIGFIFLSAPTHSQEISATANVDSSAYFIGAPIALHLEVKHDPSIFLTWEMPDSVGGGFIKIKSGASDTFHVSDGIIERKTIYVTSFDSGTQQIPAIRLFYKDLSGNYSTVSAGAVLVKIIPVNVDTSRGMKPIKTIFAVPGTGENNTFWYASVASSALIFAFLAYYFIRRKRERAVIRSVLKEEKYTYELATKKIAEIELLHLWQNDRIQEYYVLLSDVLRKYVQETFRIPALENTSSETVRLLDQKIQNKKITERLQKDLLIADLVKFARAKRFTDQHVDFMNSAKEFLEETKSYSPSLQNGAG